MKKRSKKTSKTRAPKFASLRSLRKHAIDQYTLLLRSARTLMGKGMHPTFVSVRADLDAYESNEKSPRWVAGVHPADGDAYYDGYVVGFQKHERFANEREALVALNNLLFAVITIMNPFMKDWFKDRRMKKLLAGKR